MKITAIVVTYNEERRLEACLKSLKFCSQIIVMDIGSTDHSVEIAEKCGIKVLHHSWVPAVEELWPQIVPMAENDWIIRLDPDEIIPESLGCEILTAIDGCDERCGMFILPHQYYFCGTPLETSTWGGIKYMLSVFHREKVILTGQVHHGMKFIDGYVKKEEIPYNGTNAIQHYWIDSYQQLWEKHWRYIKLEGKARYYFGVRFSLFLLFRETARAFYSSMIVKRGWRGGFTGVFLSIFYSWYTFMSFLSLAVFQIKHS
jgi:glycosyltransferase involved in cell wall biosynthesis